MGGEASTSARPQSEQRDSRLDRFLSKISDKEDQIIWGAFVQQFPQYAMNLAFWFFTYMRTKKECVDPETDMSKSVVSRQECYEALHKVQSLTSTQSQLQFYMEVFCCKDGINEKAIFTILESAFILSMDGNGMSHAWTDEDQEEIKKLAQTIASKGSESAAANWMDRHCPEAVSRMHTDFLNIIYSQKESDIALADLNPVFHERLLTMYRWWLLTSSLPPVFTQQFGQKSSQGLSGASANKEADVHHWSMLYSSQDHGLSLNRFKHHVFGYRGPTILMLSCEGGYTYAAAIDIEWRDGIQSWGGANCHIIRMCPDFQILEDGDNMVVFNEKSRNIPKGVWIGRDSRNRKLHIEEGFETVTHNFQPSKIICLEVWGCGDDSAKAEQVKQKKTELKDAAKAAKVKLPGEWDENPDKAILELGGVKTNHGEYR